MNEKISSALKDLLKALEEKEKSDKDEEEKFEKLFKEEKFEITREMFVEAMAKASHEMARNVEDILPVIIGNGLCKIAINILFPLKEEKESK